MPRSRCACPQARAAHRRFTPVGSPASELLGRVNDSLTRSPPRTGAGGVPATRLLVAVGALHPFVPLLCFDRQGRDRTRPPADGSRSADRFPRKSHKCQYRYAARRSRFSRSACARGRAYATRSPARFRARRDRSDPASTDFLPADGAMCPWNSASSSARQRNSFCRKYSICNGFMNSSSSLGR